MNLGCMEKDPVGSSRHRLGFRFTFAIGWVSDSLWDGLPWAPLFCSGMRVDFGLVVFEAVSRRIM